MAEFFPKDFEFTACSDEATDSRIFSDFFSVDSTIISAPSFKKTQPGSATLRFIKRKRETYITSESKPISVLIKAAVSENCL